MLLPRATAEECGRKMEEEEEVVAEDGWTYWPWMGQISVWSTQRHSHALSTGCRVSGLLAKLTFFVRHINNNNDVLPIELSLDAQESNETRRRLSYRRLHLLYLG